MCALIVKPLIRDYWQVWCLIMMKICHGYQRKTHWNRKQRITAKLYITLVLNVNKTHKPNTNFYCSTWNVWRQLKFLLCFFFSHFYSILHKLLQVRLSMFACLSRAMRGEADRAETRSGPFKPRWTSVFGEFNNEIRQEQGFLRNEWSTMLCLSLIGWVIKMILDSQAALITLQLI